MAIGFTTGRSWGWVSPYSIYYDIEGGIAKVYAVIDNRRDPDWVRMHISNVR